jgi:lipopolysaccharide transport system ATP-binding protein
MRNFPEKGAVEFDHVSKRYRLGTSGSLRGALAGWLSRGGDAEAERRVLWALRDVNFSLMPGGSLGLVGPNGSGKTTALKLLSQVTYPTAGKVVVRGRISSLIELGAGFHPELTGRENIYLNGAILGLTRQEITSRLEAIIAFSELERFIDTPVKRYSSGMYVRLGFAVAAHVEPDILLVDEVLAVGDASFRHRCVQRMKEMQQNGTTLLFVSHNMHLVRTVCDSAVLLLGGRICAEGKPSDVISEYEKLLTSADTADAAQGGPGREAPDAGDSLLMKAVEVVPAGLGADGQLDGHLPATVRIHYHAVVPQQIGRMLLSMIREDSTVCNAVDSSHWPEAGAKLGEVSGEGVITVTYNPLQLTAGTYLVEVLVTDISDNIVIASGQSPRFRVGGIGSGQSRGIYIPMVSWDRQPVVSNDPGAQV